MTPVDDSPTLHNNDTVACQDENCAKELYLLVKAQSVIPVSSGVGSTLSKSLQFSKSADL